jgi:hypothetical protein
MLADAKHIGVLTYYLCAMLDLTDDFDDHKFWTSLFGKCLRAWCDLPDTPIGSLNLGPVTLASIQLMVHVFPMPFWYITYYNLFSQCFQTATKLWGNQGVTIDIVVWLSETAEHAIICSDRGTIGHKCGMPYTGQLELITATQNEACDALVACR